MTGYDISKWHIKRCRLSDNQYVKHPSFAQFWYMVSLFWQWS